jgi:gluconate 2-dehydrogenase gamma chain
MADQPEWQALTADEARAISSICDRIFPTTDDLPSGSALGVVTYIDRQLAGPWGQGARLYREGPFETPADSGHGWQLALTPRDAYREGLAALARYTRSRYGLEFADLPEAEQDEVLRALEAGTLDAFEAISSTAFFELVLGNVTEGLYADPVHGGNRNADTWKWLGFPGDPFAFGEPYRERIGRSDGRAR